MKTLWTSKNGQWAISLTDQSFPVKGRLVVVHQKYGWTYWPERLYTGRVVFGHPDMPPQYVRRAAERYVP